LFANTIFGRIVAAGKRKERAMATVTPIKGPKYYRVMVRVILNGKAYYHSTYGENQEGRVAFSLREIQQAFKIDRKDAETWKAGAYKSLVEAQRTLDKRFAEKVGAFFEVKGFFVTVRPNNPERTIDTESYRSML
jgi:hypothetical protein